MVSTRVKSFGAATCVTCAVVLTASLWHGGQAGAEIRQNAPSFGAIGDVKASMLAPAEFRQQNGEGWILMDGRAIKGSDLAVSGMQSVPDGRGVFLRGMNEGRKDTEEHGGDPDGDRPVGTFQWDAVQQHTHSYHDRAFGHNLNNRGYPNKSEDDDGADINRTTRGHSGRMSEDGSETRPRNIVVYLYIKINYG